MTAPRVYKIGGPALEDPGLMAPLAEEIKRGEGPVVLVHGGGRHVERTLRALGVESRFVGGRRETSPAAMEVVEMVLSGVINKSLAAGLTAVGVLAVGVSGRDAGLVEAERVPDLGRVGVPRAVRVAVLEALWSAGLVPVVSPVCSGKDGQSLNVNADETALAIAVATRARSLVYLSDVDGVRVEGNALARLSAEDARRGIADGSINGGMALKIRVAQDAARAGIEEVVVAGKARLLGTFAGTIIAPPSAEAERGA